MNIMVRVLVCLIAWPLLKAMSFVYENREMPIADEIATAIIEQNKGLNDHDHFVPALIKDAQFQRKALSQENTQPVTLHTADGVTIDALFIDRSSDHVLIVGQGCHAAKEKLIPFLKLFTHYDLLIFDYRWLAWQRSWFSLPRILYRTLTKYFIESQQDIIAAVHFLRDKKKYTSINGLGLCYSGMLFCSAQAESLKMDNKPLFDKLIIDSALYSMKQLTQVVVEDPCLCFDNKKGGAPAIVTGILSSRPIRWLTTAAGNCILGSMFSRLKITDAIADLGQTPLLLIHARGDKLVPLDYFWQMYDATNKSSPLHIYFRQSIR